MSDKTESGVGVFISYSHADRFIAETLSGRLRDVGYRPWVDFTGIEGGDDWKRSIEEGLERSTAVLVILTPEAAASEWVRYEVTRAKALGGTIIPLLFRPTPLPPILEPYQYIDFQQSGDAAFAALQRALLGAIVRGGRTPATSSTSLAPAETTPPGSQPAGAATAQNPRALVVEDLPNYQDLLRDLLQGMGLAVDVAGTRSEAVSLLQAGRYDFITLDMQLGPDDVMGQEGISLLESLQYYQSGVPVVMITSLPFDKNRTAQFFHKYGIKHMLDKPFDSGELRALVAEHVRWGKA